MQKADEYLKSELKRLTDEAERISDAARTENRKMTDEEVEKIEERVEKAKDIRSQLGEWEKQEELRAAIQRAGDINQAPPTQAQEDAKTVGDAFVRSPGYKALKDRGFAGGTWSSGPVAIDGSKVINSPETGTPRVEALDLAGGALPLAPQVVGGVVAADLPLQAPAISDLFSQGRATSNTIVYLEETAETPGALSAPYLTSSAANVNAVLTSEGTAKPAAFVDFTKRTVALDKLAAFLPVSEELLEDEPAIVAYINTRLALFVRQAEDKRILARLITAASGNTAGFTELGGVANTFDSIMAGITMVRVEGGLEPDAVVMNPIDFAKMMIAKASTAGSYFNGGPYGALAGGGPWGLRTVVTGAVAAGSPIVGAFREGGQVWRKGGLTVEASNSHNDYFRYNLVALRAEERVGLAVYRPRAFQTLFLAS